MSQNRVFLVATVLLVLVGASIWIVNPPEATEQQADKMVAEECNSCTARHQNLSRLRDARSSETKEDE